MWFVIVFGVFFVFINIRGNKDFIGVSLWDFWIKFGLFIIFGFVGWVWIRFKFSEIIIFICVGIW